MFFDSPGAVLEVIVVPIDDALLVGWRSRVERAAKLLGWPGPRTAVRRHAGGASLALSAPCDQLLVATEVNEWALCATLLESDPQRWRELPEMLVAAALEDASDADLFVPPVLEDAAALERLQRLSVAEARPRFRSLIAEARKRDLQYVFDETAVTLGAGSSGEDFAVTDLPDSPAVPWNDLQNIPVAVVTGSNGKTTTVRLLAACARAHGWHTAYTCTDGVFFDDETIATGDYSGPLGARMAIRERRAEATVIETARGGILRRGIALSRADVAVVTNVSSDHFGEYGIHDLDGLADTKLTVASIVAPEGLVVLNVDDGLLRAKARALPARLGRAPPVGWFSADADHPELQAHRSREGATCGVRAGRLVLTWQGIDHDLGTIASMPLTVDASATYNIANLAGAALAASALGIAPANVAAVFARFGADPADNVGRMMRYQIGGVQVVLDYAHNADGLRGLLRVIEHLRGGKGRLGLLLGHAGNRQNAEIQELARVAAEARPDLVVVKENDAHLRGRQQGEVPRIIRDTLLRSGLAESALPVRLTEVEAARCALEWARPGDVLALPVHSASARAEVVAMLEARVSA